MNNKPHLFIRYYSNVDPTPVQVDKFSNGDLRISYPSPKWSNNAFTYAGIIAYLQSSDDIMALCLLNDVLERNKEVKKKELIVPFLPYSRQDRPMGENVPFSLKAFSKIINSLGFDSVTTFDVHSDVPHGTIDNFINVKPLTNSYLEICNTDAFVSPDAGAFKKVSELALKYEKSLITALKVRDVTNGNITNSFVVEKTVPKHVTIIDDICDGGATFIPLAKSLRERGAEIVNLYVSHGIFSKGFDALREHINHIYTTDTICRESPLPADFVSVLRVVFP